MPRIALQGVRKVYDGHAAVDGVDLAVAPGAFVVIVGASGSGKSTTLKTINRMVDPDAGTVRLDGDDVRDADPIALRRGIGWAIQRGGLLPHRSVADNVAIVPRLKGWGPDRVRARVDAMLTLVALEPGRFRDRRPAELSGGEQQRVGLARALAGEPAILLLDEPFGALDARTRVQLQDDVRALHDRLGLTTVMVTHDMVAALRLADVVVVMAAGTVRQAAPPAVVWAQPADDAVADLLDVARDHARFLSALGAS